MANKRFINDVPIRIIMAKEILKRIEDPLGYVGIIFKREKYFFAGDVYYAEVRKKDSSIGKKRIGTSGVFRNDYIPVLYTPKITQFKFTKKGLEVDIEKFFPSKKKKFVISR